LGLGILAGLGTIAFVMASALVPRDLKWALTLGIIAFIGVITALAALLAFRSDYAWMRSFLKAAPNDPRLADSSMQA
jgi:hypothetical protein